MTAENTPSSKGPLNQSSRFLALAFLLVVPLMLVLFFGTVEFSTGVAVNRKVTMMARTLSDLRHASSTWAVPMTFVA